MADNTQLWAQQRQGYRSGQTGVRQPTFPGVAQPPAVNSGLSREERQEAKRIAEEANFSFVGYQVVRREFISHRFEFLINPTERKLAIRPCDEGARDAVRWCVVRGDKRKSREITCRPFTAKLYELMGWEEIYRYKLQGMRITYQGECLYLFDLSAKEAFLPQTRDPETGKVKRPKPILPKEWLETFGMNVEEHTASTQIDLSEGFISSDINDEEPEKPPVGDENTEVVQ